MSKEQIKLLNSLGIEIKDNLGINDSQELCNKNIIGAGIPLSKPCILCGMNKYCVKCSYMTQINGEIKYYCANYQLREPFN